MVNVKGIRTATAWESYRFIVHGVKYFMIMQQPQIFAVDDLFVTYHITKLPSTGVLKFVRGSLSNPIKNPLYTHMTCTKHIYLNIYLYTYTSVQNMQIQYS